VAKKTPDLCRDGKLSGPPSLRGATSRGPYPTGGKFNLGIAEGAMKNKKEKDCPGEFRVTKALPPARQVGGRGSFIPDRKLNRRPDFPPRYPRELRAESRIILDEAVERFPDRKQALDCGKDIFSNLKRLFRDAVGNKLLDSYSAIERMDELQEFFVRYNSEGGKEIELARGLDNSEERLAFNRAMCELSADAGKSVVESTNEFENAHSESDREGRLTERELLEKTEKETGKILKARIDEFLRKARLVSDSRIKREHIWRLAGYSDRTGFQRFQRGRQVTDGSSKKFNDILQLSPEKFVQRVEAEILKACKISIEK
jgi:hypothetical protein